jgi:hypothetical protein
MTTPPLPEAQLLRLEPPNISDREWPRPTFWLTAVTALAFALLMAYMEFHLHFLEHRTETDDGVYFGEGVLLAHGIVPYRSYIDVQPPG